MDVFGYLHGSLEALSTDQGWRAIGFYGIDFVAALLTRSTEIRRELPRTAVY
jgi:hypothetical protein